MKEQYIKQVEKELSLPRKMKKEVVRDLNEVFASAMEHGETEQQIIQRLGTPKEFADSTAEQFGIDNTKSKKRNGIISTLAALVIAAAAFSVYVVTQSGKVPEGAIGQADATTNIQIEGAFAFDISQILLAYWVCSNSYCSFVNYPNHTQKQEVTNEEIYFCIHNHDYDFFGCVF